MRGFLQLGVDLYRHIHLSQSISSLNKGLDVVNRLHVWSWMPHLAARVYFYLGLCNVDLGQPENAQMYFRRAFMLNPAMKIQKGYYPNRTERAIRAAFTDFRASLHVPDLPPQFDPGKVMRQEKADAAVFVYAYKSGTGHTVLGVRIIDPGLKQGHFDREFDSPADTDIDTGIRALADAFLSCARLPWKRMHKSGKPYKLIMDTTALYTFYAKYPTRRFFHNAGFNLSFSFPVQHGLDIMGAFELATSIGDPYHDMVEGLTSYRVHVGASYYFQWPWGQIFLTPGLSIGYLGGYKITTNANCKFLGPDGPGCLPTSFDKGGNAITFSLSVLFGVRLKLTRVLFFRLSAEVEGLFAEIPLSGHQSMTDLNFPIGFQAGLSYRFQ